MESQKGSKFLMLAVPILVLAVAILSMQIYVSASSVNNSADTTQNKTITVTGNGEVMLSPDTAYVIIGVLSQNKTAQQALQTNAAITSRIINALQSVGISKENISTVYFSIDPVYSCCSPSNKEIIGYSTTNQMQVSVFYKGNVTALGQRVAQVIDLSVQQGASSVYGVQFTVSETEMRNARLNATILAVQDAATQANMIARELGVSIVGPLSVNPTYYYPGPVVYSASSLQTQIIPPSTLKVSSSVTIVYQFS